MPDRLGLNALPLNLPSNLYTFSPSPQSPHDNRILQRIPIPRCFKAARKHAHTHTLTYHLRHSVKKNGN
jgi:hypothetical protein